MRLLILFTFFCINIFAQALNLTQALDILKHENLELKVSHFEVQEADMSIDMANAQHFGQLNFIQNVFRSDDAGNVFGYSLSSREANFGNFGFSDFDPSNPDILNVEPKDLNYPDSRNFFQSKLVYELPIYTGNKITAYTNMAKHMKQISILEEEKQLQEKIYELRKSYFNMGLLNNSLKNLHLILNNISRLEETTQSMVNEGYAKKVDILEVKSKKANIQRVISELEANKELLYHYLSFLLNQDVSNIITPTQDLNAPDITAEEILSKSIDIKQAKSALEVYDSLLDAEQSRYLPTIGAMAEVQTSDDTFLGDASDHKSYTVGVQLKWNIFGGGGDAAAIEKAQIQKLKSKTQIDLAKKGIALKIKEIQTNIKQSNLQIKNLKVELSLAQEIYKNYAGRYSEQLISMSDVIVKQSIWLEDVLSLLQARNSRNQQIFALEKLALLGERND